MSAANTIKHGNTYPFDIEGDTDYSTTAGTDWTIIAARGILSDLCDRRGVKQELRAIDLDIREELVQSLADIIGNASENREALMATDFNEYNR